MSFCIWYLLFSSDAQVFRFFMVYIWAYRIYSFHFHLRSAFVRSGRNGNAVVERLVNKVFWHRVL